MELINTIIRYKKIENELREALKEAGGNANLILSQNDWVAVIATLAANRIEISAAHRGKNS